MFVLGGTFDGSKGYASYRHLFQIRRGVPVCLGKNCCERDKSNMKEETHAIFRV